MEFGRHPNPDEVDFQLPPWKSYIIPEVPVNKMTVFVGATSWINTGWKGHIYPDNLRKGEELFYYSRQFNSIELNSTYYGIPPVKRVINWSKSVPNDFAFCPKFPQHISNASTINFPKNKLVEFLEVLYTFEEKMGVAFFQFPTKLNPVKMFDRLNEILTMIPPELRVMFEIRHSETYLPENVEVLKEMFHGKPHGLVITDTPGCRSIIHNLLFTETVFIRFVSCGVFQIDYLRLNHWLNRLAELSDKGIKTVYFFVHEGESNPLPMLALYLSDKIRNLPEYIFRGPELIDEIPEQMTLF